MAVRSTRFFGPTNRGGSGNLYTVPDGRTARFSSLRVCFGTAAATHEVKINGTPWDRVAALVGEGVELCRSDGELVLNPGDVLSVTRIVGTGDQYFTGCGSLLEGVPE